MEIPDSNIEVHAIDPEAPEVSHQEVLAPDIEETSTQISPETLMGVIHFQPEDIQELSDLQKKQQHEVFVFNLSDPFSENLESLSSFDVRVFLLNDRCLLCPLLAFFIPHWFPEFFISESRILQANKILVWFHWKHDFT